MKNMDENTGAAAVAAPPAKPGWVEYEALEPADQSFAYNEMEADILKEPEGSLLPVKERVTNRLAEYLFQPAGDRVWRKMRSNIVQALAGRTGKPLPRVPKPKKDKVDGVAGDHAKTTNSQGDAVPVADEDRIFRLPLDKLMPCPLNPRTRSYDPAKLNELAENIGGVGIVHPLLVRPAPTWEPGAMYEVIAGHRRLKAAQIVKLETLPVNIRNVSDADALIMMLSENLQREDLSPVEEAEGMAQMLELKAANGENLFDRAGIAEKLGKTVRHVQNILRLLRLPKKAKQAIDENKIGYRTGTLIAMVPGEKSREQLTKEVLAGYDESGPLNYKETADLIRKDYMVQLRNAPFDPADSKLGPAAKLDDEGKRISGGACTDCPMNSANGDDRRDSHHHLCMNPECFRAKIQANLSQKKEKALAAGAVIITGQQASRLLDWEGKPAHSSGLVLLDEKPNTAEVNTSKPPTWRKMVFGTAETEVVVGRDADDNAVLGKRKAELKAPFQLIIDDKGRALEVVDRKVAIEAAKKNGFENLFKQGASRATSAEDAKRLDAQRVENEKKKIETAVTCEALRELAEAITKRGGVPELWFALVKCAAQHAGADGTALVCKRCGIEGRKDSNGYVDKYKAVRDFAEGKLNHGNEMLAFIVELLLSQAMRWSGINSDGFKPVAKVYGLDLKAIESRIKAEFAEKKKNKGKKPEKTEARKGELIPGAKWIKGPSADGFKFNAHSVCSNPDAVEFEFPAARKFQVTIALAKGHKGWHTGYSVYHGSPGCVGSGHSGSGASLNGDFHATSLDALIFELSRIAKSKDADDKVKEILGGYLRALREKKSNIR